MNINTQSGKQRYCYMYFYLLQFIIFWVSKKKYNTQNLFVKNGIKFEQFLFFVSFKGKSQLSKSNILKCFYWYLLGYYITRSNVIEGTRYLGLAVVFKYRKLLIESKILNKPHVLTLTGFIFDNFFVFDSLHLIHLWTYCIFFPNMDLETYRHKKTKH